MNINILMFLEKSLDKVDEICFRIVFLFLICYESYSKLKLLQVSAMQVVDN